MLELADLADYDKSVVTVDCPRGSAGEDAASKESLAFLFQQVNPVIALPCSDLVS